MPREEMMSVVGRSGRSGCSNANIARGIKFSAEKAADPRARGDGGPVPETRTVWAMVKSP